MANDIRKFYTLNASTNKMFSLLDEEQKVLVESGFKVAKQYMAEKTKETSKDVFAMLNDSQMDNRMELNNMTVEKIAKYAAKRAGFNVENFELKEVANPNVHNNYAFKETFAAVLAQIMTPIVPAMISTEFMDLADVANIGWGDTARFRVNSNDMFYVTRLAEGIRDGSVQRLYNNEVVVNPEPYNITTAVDWYQVAAGLFDLGEFVYKVGVSYNAYICTMIIGALRANITQNAGNAYFVNGYSTVKFAKLAETLRAANGGQRVHAYGTLPALSQVIPEAANILNMQMGIGDEWSHVGHLYRYMDVDLVRIPQILLPNTVNSTPLAGIPDNMIYMFAAGGYKPIKLVFEGSAFTHDIVPTEVPDKEMGLSLTLRMGTTFVAASKFGAITLA